MRRAGNGVEDGMRAGRERRLPYVSRWVSVEANGGPTAAPDRATVTNMVAASPLDLTVPPADLSPEDAEWLGSFIALCEEEEALHPGLIDREIAASEAYGNDFARELADIQAGRHPLQQPR